MSASVPLAATRPEPPVLERAEADLPARAPGLPATIAAEWSKLAARRSTYTIVGIGFVLAIGMTILAGVAVGATWKHWSPADKADFDPVEYSFLGLIFSGILLMVLGIRVVASEYASGMIRVTLVATPHRERLFAAKFIAIALVTAAAGLLASLGDFLVAQVVFGAYGLPTTSLAHGDAVRAVLVAGAVTPVYPLLGAALAVITRSVAAPLTGILVLTFAPGILASLLSNTWQNALRYTPGAASDRLSYAHASDPSSLPATPVSLLVIAIWLAVFLGVALVVFRRRDA